MNIGTRESLVNTAQPQELGGCTYGARAPGAEEDGEASAVIAVVSKNNNRNTSAEKSVSTPPYFSCLDTETFV